MKDSTRDMYDLTGHTILNAQTEKGDQRVCHRATMRGERGVHPQVGVPNGVPNQGGRVSPPLLGLAL